LGEQKIFKKLSELGELASSLGGRRRLVVIVAEGCPACEALKRRLAESKAKIELLDVTKSPEAARIMRDLGMFKVPLLVLLEGDRACAFDDEKKEVKCVKSVPSEEELRERASASGQ